MFRTEEEGIFIKRGKELLQLTVDNLKDESENNIGDVMAIITEEDERVNEILESNGFLDRITKREEDFIVV